MIKENLSLRRIRKISSKHVIEGFKHKIGGHCESTTMRDLIVHAGIDITEEMVFGLDSTFGFTFFDNSQGDNSVDMFNMGVPFFIGGKQGSIVKDSMACSILGLNITFETFSSSGVAWESSKKRISQNIPLGLQVDMGCLSYFDWEEEMHFGGHSISLIGFDEEKNQAYICDNGFDDVQTVSFDELKIARSSKFGNRFLNPKNKQFHILKRADGKKPPFPKAAKLALQQVARQVISPSMNHHGIPALELFTRSIPTWQDTLKGTMKSPYTSKMVPKASFTFEMIYGLIEEMGTGGAIFRNIYSNFLKELLQHPELNEGIHAWKEEELFYLEDAHENLSKSAKLWNMFSGQIKQVLDKNKEDCLDQIDLKELEEILTDIILSEESCFTSLLQIKL